MVLILNFIISIICDVEKEVRTDNKSKDWLNYLYSKVSKLAKKSVEKRLKAPTGKIEEKISRRTAIVGDI